MGRAARPEETLGATAATRAPPLIMTMMGVMPLLLRRAPSSSCGERIPARCRHTRDRVVRRRAKASPGGPKVARRPRPRPTTPRTVRGARQARTRRTGRTNRRDLFHCKHRTVGSRGVCGTDPVQYSTDT